MRIKYCLSHTNVVFTFSALQKGFVPDVCCIETKSCFTLVLLGNSQETCPWWWESSGSLLAQRHSATKGSILNFILWDTGSQRRHLRTGMISLSSWERQQFHFQLAVTGEILGKRSYKNRSANNKSFSSAAWMQVFLYWFIVSWLCNWFNVSWPWVCPCFI